MVLTCIVVDDDPYIIDQLTDYINDLPTLNLTKSYTDATNALSDMLEMEKPIDILFTDIEMPKFTGLDLAKAVKHKIKSLVLISGHLQYALDGYGVGAADFLVKPVGFKKFKSLVDSQITKVTLRESCIFIKIKGDKVYERVDKNEIVYIEAERNYAIIYNEGKSFTTLTKLTELQEKLDDFDTFIRIHKSFIVNKKYIRSYKNRFIILSTGTCIPVGNTFLKQAELSLNL